MRYTHLIIWFNVTFAAGISGQNTNTTTTTTSTKATTAPTNLPSCPDSCLNDVLAGTTPSGCADVTVSCICASTQGLRSIMCCVKARCSNMDQQETVSTWIDTCAGYATAPNFLNQLGCINSTISATGNTTSPASSSSSSKSTTLTKGAGIGIGVGIGMLTLAITLFLLYFLLRQRKKRAIIKEALDANESGKIESGKIESGGMEGGKAELDGIGAVPRVELDGTVAGGKSATTADEKRLTHELDSPVTIHEINSENDGPPRELQGSSVPLPQELDGRVKEKK